MDVILKRLKMKGKSTIFFRSRSKDVDDDITSGNCVCIFFVNIKIFYVNKSLVKHCHFLSSKFEVLY